MKLKYNKKKFQVFILRSFVPEFSLKINLPCENVFSSNHMSYLTFAYTTITHPSVSTMM